jgi:hypothetical protein
MWKDTHLVERDLEVRVDMERWLNNRLREAEQWRLAREAKRSSKAPGFFPANLLNLIATALRPWLVGSPKPQDDCG